MRKSLATNMFINGCDLDSIRNQLGHASVLTALIYIKATPKIHKSKYDAYCPLYKDSQRTPDALIIRQITRDPLNVIASHEPRPVTVVSPATTGVIDIQAIPILPESDRTLPSCDKASSASVTLAPEEAKLKKSAKKDPSASRRQTAKKVLGADDDITTGEAKHGRSHTFQISLFDDDPQKLVLMSDAPAQPMTMAQKAAKFQIPRVNKRQKLALIRMHENGEAMTNRLYRTLNDVSRSIARHELTELCERGILQCEGMGRSVSYWLKVSDQGSLAQ